MSSVLWWDCQAGAAGDMLLASLLDAGAPLELVLEGLQALALEPFAVSLIWGTGPETVTVGLAAVALDNTSPPDRMLQWYDSESPSTSADPEAVVCARHARVDVRSARLRALGSGLRHFPNGFMAEQNRLLTGRLVGSR